MKRSSTTICAPARPSRRYQFVCSSLTVGVVKLKVCGFASLRPLAATAIPLQRHPGETVGAVALFWERSADDADAGDADG